MESLRAVINTVPTSITFQGPGTFILSNGVAKWIGKDNTLTLTLKGFEAVKTDN